MEHYKGIIDKEGNKLEITSKYQLECTRSFLFKEGYTVSDVSSLNRIVNGIVSGIVSRIIKLAWQSSVES